MVASTGLMTSRTTRHSVEAFQVMPSAVSFTSHPVTVAHHVYGVAQTINSANYVYFKCLKMVQDLGEPEAVKAFTGSTNNQRSSTHNIRTTLGAARWPGQRYTLARFHEVPN